MKCYGCYKEGTDGFCPSCRKKLFAGARVSPDLPFRAPHADLPEFREHTKRLSISGVQLKFSLALEGKTLFPTDTGGQYILKPVPPNIAHAPEAPENEHLTMQIAEQIFGIRTAANALVKCEGQYAYLTRRFDINKDGTRYLQEDFAQITGRSKNSHGDNFKYQGTYEDIGVLIKRYVAAYQPAMERFFTLIIFNYLFSNGDAHLKNFSLVTTDTGEYILAPAYDLMCTIIHVPGETDTALDLFEGDTTTPYYQTYGHHGYPDLMELAKRLGIIEKRAIRIIGLMTGQQQAVATMIEGSFLSPEVKRSYLAHYLDKVKRIKPN